MSDPRAEAVAQAVGAMVARHDFAEACAMLRGYLRDLQTARETRLEALFRAWLDLPAEGRPAFWEWSHGQNRDGCAPGQPVARGCIDRSAP